MTPVQRDLEAALGTLVSTETLPSGQVVEHYVGAKPGELIPAFEAYQRELRRLDREEARRAARLGSYLTEYGPGLALFVPWLLLLLLSAIRA